MSTVATVPGLPFEVGGTSRTENVAMLVPVLV
jgi:hypothetical protein